MHTDKVVYIAGPYRADTAWDIEQNTRRAEDAALYVAHLGATPLCPHTMTRFMQGTLTDGYWLAATLELARRCDAILLVDGWERSEGSQGEKHGMEEIGRPVFTDRAALVEWLNA